jgi:hypothetical protein
VFNLIFLVDSSWTDVVKPKECRGGLSQHFSFVVHHLELVLQLAFMSLPLVLIPPIGNSV